MGSAQQSRRGEGEPVTACVTALAGLAALEPHWRTLEQASARRHHVFQSFSWCNAWARTYVTPEGPYGLHIITGWRDGGLVFVMPLMTDRKSRLPCLRWLSEPMGQYGDVLLAAGEDPAHWLAAALRDTGRVPGLATLYLRHVRDDAIAAPFLKARCGPGTSNDKAPFLDLKLYPDEAAYDARYSRDQRKRRKRIRKDLQERGPLSFELLNHGAALDAAMAEAVAQKLGWIGERGLFNRVLSCPKLPVFLRELARANGRGTDVLTSVMSTSGTAVSWEVGLRFQGTHFGFITAHDGALTDLSPARLHMDLSQRRAIADGCEVFDLMVPMDRHKESWSSGSVAVADYALPLSALGWLHDRAYLKTLRPLLRRAYYTAPPSLRALATSLTAMLAVMVR